MSSSERVVGPVLFVCPSRPDLAATRPAWGGGRRNHSSIALDPLTPAQADLLVHELLTIEDLPPSVHARILERAEGNPFFLEEIVRQLIDEGHLVREGDRWRALDEIEQVVIPDTVQAVLAARFDLLDGQDKRVLQAAAVVGRVFWPGPVALLAHLPDDAVDASASDPRGSRARPVTVDLVARGTAGTDLQARVDPRRRVRVPSPSRPHGRARGGRRLDRRDRRRPRGRDVRVARVSPVDRGRPRGRYARRAVGGSPHRRLPMVASGVRRSPAAPGGPQGAAARRGGARSGVRRSRAHGRARDAGHGVLHRLLGRPRLAVLPRGGVHSGARRDPPTGSGWRVSRRSAATSRFDGRDPCEARCPPEETVRELWDLGFAHLPPGDTEERIRLLGIRAGGPSRSRPRAIPRPSSRSSRRPACKERRWRCGWVFPNRASAAYDQAIGPWIARGWYGRALPIWEQRATITHQVTDPLELGDFYAMGAWTHYETRALRAGTRDRRRGPRGHHRARPELRSPHQRLAHRLAVSARQMGRGTRWVRLDPPDAREPRGRPAVLRDACVRSGRCDPRAAGRARPERRPRRGDPADGHRELRPPLPEHPPVPGRQGRPPAGEGTPPPAQLGGPRGRCVGGGGGTARGARRSGTERPISSPRCARHAEAADAPSVAAFADRLEGRAALAGGDLAGARRSLERAVDRFRGDRGSLGASTLRARSRACLHRARARTTEPGIWAARAAATFDTIGDAQGLAAARALGETG